MGVITFLIGVLVWHAPLGDTLKSYLYGGLTGFWAIDWITFWGLIIFNTLVLTGRFERFKKWMIHHATADIRIQTIMLAWAFGALLEGLVGFGYPWAVVVPILVGLGIADLDAIRVAALANNAPVSYGALGAPILGLAAVTGLPLMALSASIGSIVAFLALLPPWVLIYLVSGWDGMIEAWPLAIVGSLSYVAGQWPVARYLGPYLPDLSGALVSFWILFLFVKVWRPKTIRGFGGAALPPAEKLHMAELSELGSAAEALAVWLPYIVLIAVVVSWTGPWSHLPAISWFRLSVAANSSVTQKPILSVFNFTPLRGRHLHFGFLAGAPAPLSPIAADHPAGVCQDVQADVGRAAGGVFYFRARLYFRVHGDGQLAGLRPFQDRRVLRGPGADSWVDRRGAFRQQHRDQRHVRTGASADRQAFEPAGPDAALVQLRGRGSGQADRAADRQRGRFHQQIGAQRRPSDPPQHGLDPGHARLPHFDLGAVLFFLSKLDVALVRDTNCGGSSWPVAFSDRLSRQLKGN